MEPKINEIIKTLKELDLSDYPYSEISNQIRDAGMIGYLVYTLYPNKSIFRARPNEDTEHFNSKCQLTYKPQQFNTTCQRASTPNMTMFYGSILPDIKQNGGLSNEIITPTFEAVSWLRDKSTKGIRKITYSKWNVTEPIKLIAIIQHGKFYDRSSLTKKLMNDFNTFLDKNEEKKEDTIAFTSFLASEFAKNVETNDYEYLISAAFTENIVAEGYDGVLYPSVKLGGEGFNIAITPKAADTKLQLELVVESTVYKLYDRSVLDNDLDAYLYPNQTNFELRKVHPEFHEGAEICLKQLGLKSIDELKL